MSFSSHAQGDRPKALLGTSSFGQPERAFPIYDAYRAGGGRGFDTAWIYGQAYGQGCCELTFGKWANSRAVGEEVWVLVKGAHTPECFPDRIESQLYESLDRMQRSQAALYMLHRDNPEVPVGEFVTVLADLVERRLIGGYGVSNWPLRRVQDAVSYTVRHNLPSLVGISNQFSLVDMVQPIYPGTISAKGPGWRAWLATANVTLYPWASQGRGCHALNDPEDLRDCPLTASWFSESNVERIRRTRLLADRRGVSATGLAQAWTRSHPFAVIPIIGPRQVEEVNDSLAVIDLSVTPDERDWLETGKGQEPR